VPARASTAPTHSRAKASPAPSHICTGTRPGACLGLALASPSRLLAVRAFPHGSAGAAVPSSRRHAVSRCAPSRGAKQNARSMGAGMVSSAARGHRDVSGIGGCKWDRGIVSGIGGFKWDRGIVSGIAGL
jgi:hypothetical protein